MAARVPKRAQRLGFTGFCAFLCLAGLVGLMGLVGGLLATVSPHTERGRLRAVHRDVKGFFWSWMVGWVVSWMVSWAVSWAVIFPIVGIHKNGVFRHKRVRVVPFFDKKGLQF